MKLHRQITNLCLTSMTALTFLAAQNAGAWGRFEGGHAPGYDGRWAHPDPVVVHNTYVSHGGGGCVGCGVGIAAVAGLVGGVILGAAIASPSAPPPPPQTIIVQAPPPGAEYSTLPPGCASMNVNGMNYFQCGSTWFQPFVGGNGVYYAVVPTP